jgi:hypothetical protein
MKRANQLASILSLAVTCWLLAVFSPAVTPEEWCPEFISANVPAGWNLVAWNGNCKMTTSKNPPWCCDRQVNTYRSPNTPYQHAYIDIQWRKAPGMCSPSIEDYTNPDSKNCVNWAPAGGGG